MKRLTPSPVIALAVIGTQLLGPAVLWAADQRGVRIEATRRVVVSALSGDQLTLQNGGGTKTLQFREGVAAGDRLTTGDRTMAEVLLGTRAVITLGQGTSLQFTTVTPEQTTIQVSKGTVRVAAAASALGEQGLVTVQTPTGQVQTRGGIVRVLVDAPVRSADQTPTGEARPYLASYVPPTLLAAVNTRGDVIQVEEGTAEILGAGPGAKAVTVQAGQAVGVQAGQAGPIVGITTQDSLKSGVVATAGHRSTPKEGMDNLVALQVDQATKLGNALTGAAETGEGQSGTKDESGKALNGATGGVALANAVANALFGSNASVSNASSGNPTERPGANYVANSNSQFQFASYSGASVNVNGGTKGENQEIKSNALLVFTRRDPVQSFVKEDITLQVPGFFSFDPPFTATYRKGEFCTSSCIDNHNRANSSANVVFRALSSIESKFTVAKELVLVGGTPNIGHGGIAPEDTLIIRGAAPTPSSTVFTNKAATGLGGSGQDGLYPHDGFPSGFLGTGTPQDLPAEIAHSTATFVVQSSMTQSRGATSIIFKGGTLGQFSNRSDASPDGIALETDRGNNDAVSYVDGAITATGSNVVLKGGVTLDQRTKATIGTTEATQNYFDSLGGSEFKGSLLAVIRGANNTATSVEVRDRLLGVYDGSTIDFNPAEGNKSLLSVLDAKLDARGLKTSTSSIPLIDIAAGSHFNESAVGTPVTSGSEPVVTPGNEPNVKVTSALVVRSTIPLDGALLEASAPLLALTNATMTTSSHFADLAGNKNQSMVLGDALVVLGAKSILTVNGSLLNLNAATATLNGYLFSLDGGSKLTINNGALFSVINRSSLNLTGINGNAFGVFGSGTNTLSFANTLCQSVACGRLLDSAGQAFRLNLLTGGTSPILVAGTNKDVVLPAGFNVFAGASGATPAVTMGTQSTALFHVDETSTLIIKGTSVIKR